MSTELIAGSIVRYAEPLTEAEKGQVFLVIEDRGERVAMTECGFINDPKYPIKPIDVALKSELIRA